MQNKRLMIILSIVVTVLLIPFIAMQFTNTVNWQLNDFALMGGLLLAAGLLIELVFRKVQLTKNKLIICSLILLALLLVYAELAVGIFGTPFAGS